MVTALFDTFNPTPDLILITYYFYTPFSTICISQSCAKNGSVLETANMEPSCGLFGLQQHPDDNLGSSDNSFENTHSNHSPFGKRTNQCHPLHAYGYSPSQQLLPGAPRLYHHSPFNMIPSSHPSTRYKWWISKLWSTLGSIRNAWRQIW